MVQSNLVTADKNSLKTLSRLCFTRGEYVEAEAYARRALQRDRRDRDSLYLLAQAQVRLHAYSAAVETLQRLIRLDAAAMKAYLLLAHVYKLDGCIQEEIDLLETVVSFLRNNASVYGMYLGEAWSRLGSAYTTAGESRKAMQCFLEAARSECDVVRRVQDFSNYLFVSNYAEDVSSAFMRREHARYADFFRDVRRFVHERGRTRKDRLKIGYISPDFREHPVLFFVEDLLQRYNRERFEIFCYFNGVADSATLRLKENITNWRDIRGLLPDDAAAKVYADEIDILVDLSGHTRDNVLPVLARKPAPLQICGIGYFNTTGLREVDYFLTDIHCDPPGKNDAAFTERLLRLPRTHLCYRAPTDMPAPCVVPPAVRKGFVTYGCFNNFNKVTDRLLRLWGQLLRYQSQARLLLKSKLFAGKQGRDLACRRLRSAGVDVARVELRPFTVQYLQEYMEIDIALDTFPYPGGATTCEALYMGVPVVSLYGKRHGSRFGYSLLKNIGLEELAAANEAEYLQKAVALVEDRELLAGLHQSLRGIVEASVLMNGRGYVGDVEAAYEELWQAHCSMNGTGLK